MDDRDLIQGTAAWLARTPLSEVTPELSVTDALREVPEFLSLLAAGKLPAPRFQPADRGILILRVACKVLSEPDGSRLEKPLELVLSLYDFIQRVEWPQPDFCERAELLADCAFAGWRISRRLEKAGEEARWLERFRVAAVSPSPLWSEMERILTTPMEQRLKVALSPALDDPQLLLAVCETLRRRNETSPADSRAKSEFFYSYVAKPERTIEHCDEQEHFLGELALTAGTACRVLFHRDEARQWFDRAEAHFTRRPNGLAHVARVGYQRLALAAEERRFEEVQALTPPLADFFESQGLSEESLKSRYLEAIALREKGLFAESVKAFRVICSDAEKQGHMRLVAHAATTLAQYHRLLGSFDEAMEYARKALPLLKQLDMRTTLVKLRWSVANILREQGKLSEAVPAYREALEEAHTIGMRADVVALHLVLADILLDLGQDPQAEEEIRIALPIIDEEKMVPEGYAALDLLRQALRHRQIDRQALRDLHGYFGDSQA
jgi:tetratricopeptide (TPR) repeat protein